MAIKWPLTGHISSPFGDTRGRPSPHSGTDITGRNGTAIKAGATGVVHFVGPNRYANGVLKPSGNVVTIIYTVPGGKLYALYCHIAANYPVRKGQRVSAGTTIGYVGSSGNSAGGHTHIECYLNGKLVNPQSFFAGTVPAGGGITPIPSPAPTPTPILQEDDMDMIHYTERVVDVPGIEGVRNATWKDQNVYTVFTSTWYEPIVGSGAVANSWARIVGHSSRKLEKADTTRIRAKIDALPKSTGSPVGSAPALDDATIVKIGAEVIRQQKLAGN